MPMVEQASWFWARRSLRIHAWHGWRIAPVAVHYSWTHSPGYRSDNLGIFRRYQHIALRQTLANPTCRSRGTPAGR
jgi:hypothetical protein